MMMRTGISLVGNRARIYAAVLLMLLSPLATTNRAYAATISFSANAAATVANSGKKLFMNSATYGANVSIDSVTRLMTGYAWSEEAGWVYFGSGTDNPSGPVSVNACGLLVGKAKVLTGDYIDFNASPTNSYVYVAGGSGAFTGYAWSTDLGWINFSGVTSGVGLSTGACIPALVAPSNSSVNVSSAPEFRLGSANSSGSYQRYKIQVCSDDACSAVLRTIDQTASQTGWTAQSIQSGTAYSGGAPLAQIAIHKYQPTALSANTQYWWRGAAIDPGGVNTWSDWSSIYSFTTAPATASNINIGGGVITIYGGTKVTTGN